MKLHVLHETIIWKMRLPFKFFYVSVSKSADDTLSFPFKKKIIFLSECQIMQKFRKLIQVVSSTFKNEWRQSLVPSLPSRNKTLVPEVKNYAIEHISKLCCPVQFCLISWYCFINFIRNCLGKQVSFVTCLT